MGVTVGTSFRNAALDAGLALINGGSGDATGDLMITNSSDTQVALLTFSATAFAASVSGTATANAITSDTNAAGGSAARAQFRNKANAEIMRCNVAASGSDINLSTVTIPAGGTEQITALNVTLPTGTTD